MAADELEPKNDDEQNRRLLAAAWLILDYIIGASTDDKLAQTAKSEMGEASVESSDAPNPPPNDTPESTS